MTPVITIDGPSGTGKGTLAHRLARVLGWAVLDSGALYRVLAFAAERAGISLEDSRALVSLAERFRFDSRGDRIWFGGEDVTRAIRSERIGNAASKVAAQAAVRNALLAWQRRAARPPGLVADGRDMGTVVFPQAPVKFFLTASLEERAERRLNQLKDQGLNDSLERILRDLAERDARDRNRRVAPLRPAADAQVIDTTHLSREAVFDRVLDTVRRKLPEEW